MTLLNRQYDPFQGTFFRVKLIDPPAAMGTAIEPLTFSKIEGIDEDTEYSEYRTGGDAPTPRKLAGLTKYGDVTFEDGLDPDDTMRRWRHLFIKGDATSGQMLKNGPSRRYDQYRATVEVTLEDAAGNVLHKFKLAKAWPKGVGISSIDPTTGDIIMRTVTFAHEGLTEDFLTDNLDDPHS